MNLVILGPQGSGKGTQAELLSKELGLFYFETGDFLRKIAKKDERINKIINERGKLLPDDEVFELVTGYLEENVPERDNMLLDGYPRSIKQYELLKEWLSEKSKKVDKVIALDISEEESIRRLSSRRIDKKTGDTYNLITNPPTGEVDRENLYQRPDDRPEAIKERLKSYHEKTEPLLSIFKKEGILMEVDGEREIEVIFEDILGRLENE